MKLIYRSLSAFLVVALTDCGATTMHTGDDAAATDAAADVSTRDTTTQDGALVDTVATDRVAVEASVQDVAHDVVMTACSNLLPVGVWQEVTPPGSLPATGGGIGQPLVDPLNPSTVYVGTSGHGIFKTTDCGVSWNHINTGRNGPLLDSGFSNSMAIDPVDSQVLYTTNLYSTGDNGVFKTTNGGVDWDPAFGDDVRVWAARSAFAVIISIDPTDHTHLVVAMHDGCNGQYAPDCVGETTDSGATWRPVRVDDGIATHADGNGVIVLDYNTWLYGLTFTGVWRTTDRGTTWTRVATDGSWAGHVTPNGNVYVGTAQHGILRATTSTTEFVSEMPANLYTSIDDGRNIYAGVLQCGSAHCYYTSPVGDGVTWTPMATPAMGMPGFGMGGGKKAYDAVHHVLYSGDGTIGLWRVVTY